VIGSNIFDLLIPVGLAATISPLSVAPATIWIDLPTVAMATVALLFFLLRKRGLQKGEALALVLVYVGYATLRLVSI
jgi:cation:H+ antiporter